MTDPPRLLESGSEFSRTLLRSGSHDDAGVDRAMARTAAALGLASATALTASASTAAASAAKTVAMSTSWVGLAGWFGVGTISAVLALTAGTQLTRVEQTQPATSMQGPAGPSSRDTSRPRLMQPSSPSAAADSGSLPPREIAVAKESPPRAAWPEDDRIGESSEREALPASAPSASAAAGRGAGTRLGAEVAMIDRGREALAAGKSDEALGHLDRYDREKQSGVLDPEATLIRIEAWMRQGRRAEAVALARSFVRAYPTNPQTSRLEAMIAGETENRSVP